MDDTEYVQVYVDFYLSCCFEESHNGSQFTSTLQSMTAFITSSVIFPLYTAIGEIDNDTMNMVVRRSHDSNVLSNDFEKTGKLVVSSRKRAIKDVYFNCLDYSAICMSCVRAL